MFVRRHASAPIALACAALLALSTTAATAAPDPPPANRLASLAAEYWEGQLRADPTAATSLGDRRYDAFLTDITPAGRERDRARLAAVRERALAIPEGALGIEDRITRSMLIEVVEGQIAGLDCASHEWVVDPLGGPQVDFLNLPSIQPVSTPAQGRDMVARWRAMAPWLDAHIANLREGLARGRVATSDQVKSVLDELADLLGKSPEELSLMRPAKEAPAEWPPAERAAFERELRDAVTRDVLPAFRRYEEFLEREVQPAARPQDRVGLAHLPGGAACYRASIHRHTSLDLPPEEIHRIGLAEVARIDAAMLALGSTLFGDADLAAIHARLRGDAAMHFATRDEVEAKAVEALRRAQAAIPAWFGVLPRTPCEVVRMEAHEEEHSTIAYYREPALDGSRPGRYYVNTSAPATRPRYEAEALAFHEAIPGHHLQIAIAQELTGLPEFRKHTGCTAYVEGWGLYSEELAVEMGLYSGDLDRIGKLSFEAWRACRLVVDTGMHALGWSRQDAIDFMLAHTALAPNNVENEVDRYITWPGQALAYKLGQLEILRLREEGRQRLGARFDIRDFHDTVLRNGAVTLPTLREIVESRYEALAASN